MSLIRSLFPILSDGASVAPNSNNPSYWGFGVNAGPQTTSGEVVTPARAFTLAPYFACIRNISEDVGKLPFVTYTRAADGGREQATTHPLFPLLRYASSPEATSQTFRETLTGWALGWGNGYAEIQRDAAGAPMALWPIHPSRVQVRRVDGSVVYDVSATDYQAGSMVRLPAADVLHLRGLGDDPLVGLSVIRIAAESIGMTLAAQTFGAAFFGNGAAVGGVLLHPGKLSEQAATNLRKSWADMHAGAVNAARPAVLEEGIRWEKLTIPPDEAQFLETRNFQVEEVARWFRMPLHKVQSLKGATYSNIEQQALEYVVDTLMPWLVRWEEEVRRKLIDERDRAALYAEHNVNALLRGDQAARATFYQSMITLGVMSLNEVRAMENLNPIPGEAGKAHFIQGAMTTIERIVSGQGPAQFSAATSPTATSPTTGPKG